MNAPPRLLVIEDEQDIAALLQLHLSDLPAEVTVARASPACRVSMSAARCAPAATTRRS
jgi:DNA-binding response OmpR family regulator